jgi:hypothetical protein
LEAGETNLQAKGILPLGKIAKCDAYHIFCGEPFLSPELFSGVIPIPRAGVKETEPSTAERGIVP